MSNNEKNTTMYTIAFYSAVFLFAASLYICDKIADSVNNHKNSNHTADYHIGQSNKAA